jgi:hypothetical protein
VSAAEVLLDPPSEAASWSIAALLMSQPHWARVKCEKLLAINQINEAKALRDPTERQRRLLANQLSPICSGQTGGRNRATEAVLAVPIHPRRRRPRLDRGARRPSQSGLAPAELTAEATPLRRRGARK